MASLPSGPRFALLQTYRLMSDPYRYYAQMRARYGDTYVVPALHGRVLVVTTPDAVKEVFTAPPEHFSVFGTEAIGPVLGPHSVISGRGAPLRRRRRA
jgi:cytochrome P450